MPRCSGGGALFIENSFVTTTAYTYTDERITEELDGFKIVQVTDLHNRRFFGNQDILINAIEKCEPDLIVFTGDIVERNARDIDNAVELIERAAKLAPCYFTYGNHEDMIDESLREELDRVLLENGVMLLNDTETVMAVGESKLAIYGLMYPYSSKWIEESENTQYFSLGMMHYTEQFELIAGAGIDLILSGHTHGGIVRLPFFGSVYAPNQGFFPKYGYGKFELNGTTMIVSSGLSSNYLPFRIGNPCEIVCVTLKSE